MSQNKQSNVRINGNDRSNTGNNKKVLSSQQSSQLGKQDIKEFMGSIKKFASTTTLGLEKLHHKQDILTKLGVPLPKEQKMPFK